MEITPELITQYGLLNKISTGNTYLDIIFCLLVPLLVKHLVPVIASLAKCILPGATKKKCFVRTIEYTKGSSYYWYSSDQAPPNSILQRAILNLVNTYTEVIRALPSAEVTLKKKPLSEISKDSDGGTRDGADGDDSSETDSSCNDTRSDEHAYSYNTAPRNGEWVDLKNGISFRNVTEELGDKNRSARVKYELRSEMENGSDRIAKFVKEALQVYRQQQSRRVDPSRYLYMPVLPGVCEAPSDDSASRPSALYKRYKLSEERTFASLFHPDKDGILRLVDQFIHKTGKFAIPGYPQKLGFLLYGPPGTGKTSLIKALAHHTKRSIISVPLSKISTNQELMDIVFDSQLKIQNSSDTAISLPFEKTIFVMEDVDAASNVVQRRMPSPGGAGSLAPTRAEVVALAEQIANAKLAAAKVSGGSSSVHSSSRSPPSRDTSSCAGGDGSCDQDEDAGGSSCKDGRSGGSRVTVIPGGGGGTGWETGVGIGPSLPLCAFGKGLFKGDDELNLAGLLNVLDGVVDTPNRIVIMTTNHPEKLDPALIRPGRINRKVYMGRLRVAEALAMMRHYFGPLSPEDEADLRRVFVDEELSPADLEAMCAEYDTVPELVAAVAMRQSGGGSEF